jgi:ankyrin repeat protein
VAEVNKWLDKGYHLESMDGRRHTALSEAACQGHIDMLRFLLEKGADPNAPNDTGRTGLWRAAFNGFGDCVSLLLGELGER